MEAKHLKKFIKQNHVLLLYHGWSDPVLTPFNTLNLFTNIQSTFGTTVSNNVRLFMVPGMHQCHGGPGPNFIGPGPGVEDPVMVLDLWAREGLAPDGISTSNPIIATHFVQNDLGGTVDRTMPLCSWPEVPSYIGVGNPNNFANWTCVTPAPG
jgi:feruloyl esterase